MSVNDLLRLFEEVEKTADYQFETAVVDMTEQICEIMEAKGISRADLARQLGKSRAWVTKVLRGDRNLTLKTITDVFWELGYNAKIEATPRWSSAAAWDQNIGDYTSQDVITVYTQTGQRSGIDECYIEQPIEEPKEQKDVFAA